MKPKISLSILALGFIVSAFGQKPILELTFTAIDSATYVQLDSIKVMNRTQGGDTVLYWPDTVLVLEYYPVGMPELNPDQERLKVFQNYPNPVVDHTTISLYVPEKDKVNLIVSDMLGRVIIKTDRVLDKGTHSFQFTPGEGNLFFFTAQWKSNSNSIKILHSGFNVNRESSLQYIDSDRITPQIKAADAIQSFFFSLGDELLYIGYANGLQSGLLDAPEVSETYTFQFATNVPCPGTPTVTYEGQVYNTIQIFSQCWLKENLNVGVMIPGSQDMGDNDTVEKYCYFNNPLNCNTYGGLYQWDEMMQYETIQGTQGICPPGWHLPTDEEWKVLEGSVDSQYGIGDQIWNSYGLRGYDAGTNLKTTSGWTGNGNGIDLFGFSGLPGGYRYSNGYFYYIGLHSLWWSSTEGNSTSSWNRYLSYNNPKVDRDYGDNKEFGFSVRCLHDN